MSENENEVRQGFGCLLFVVAVFLAVVLWNIAPETIDFLEHWLETHS